ncbi:MAG TPA: NAD(P)H-binding protein, partial [candidate division Zixibacteria bacterium]|nr:NAD(P)H-binding protein [candidate division Zixibacteria bacterium]
MSAVELTAIRDESILVTGASGLLGRQIVFELVKRGIRPVCLVRESSDTRYLESQGLELRRADLRNPEELAVAFAGVQRVIHAAGLVNFRGDKLTQFTGINSFGALLCYRAARAA